MYSLQPNGPVNNASFCPKCSFPIWTLSQGRPLWEPIGQDERLPDSNPDTAINTITGMIMNIITNIMATIMDMVTTITRIRINPFASKELTMAPERRIVQIINSVTGQNLNVLALCDDGSVWQYQFGSNSWARLADIPQL